MQFPEDFQELAKLSSKYEEAAQNFQFWVFLTDKASWEAENANYPDNEGWENMTSVAFGALNYIFNDNLTRFAKLPDCKKLSCYERVGRSLYPMFSDRTMYCIVLENKVLGLIKAIDPETPYKEMIEFRKKNWSNICPDLTMSQMLGKLVSDAKEATLGDFERTHFDSVVQEYLSNPRPFSPPSTF